MGSDKFRIGFLEMHCEKWGTIIYYIGVGVSRALNHASANNATIGWRYLSHQDILNCDQCFMSHLNHPCSRGALDVCRQSAQA